MEHSFNTFFSGHRFLASLSGWYYATFHFVVTIGVLVWLGTVWVLVIDVSPRCCQASADPMPEWVGSRPSRTRPGAVQ